jgi:hypothetical protein
MIFPDNISSHNLKGGGGQEIQSPISSSGYPVIYSIRSSETPNLKSFFHAFFSSFLNQDPALSHHPPHYLGSIPILSSSIPRFLASPSNFSVEVAASEVVSP